MRGVERPNRVRRGMLQIATAGAVSLGLPMINIDTDGIDHPRKVFDLTEALIRRGYSDENIAAVLGGNFRRLLAAIWK
jgi:microsomal dipeptidase-like Zn-dependent dipeptidase